MPGNCDTGGDITNKENCRVPTEDNPFMNPTYGYNESGNDVMVDSIKPACNVNNPDIKKQIKETFYKSIPDKKIDNEFGFANFYTVPASSVPNNQEAFANFLYGDMKNCKKDSCDCEP